MTKKAFASIKRGVQQAIRHRRGRRVSGLRFHVGSMRIRYDEKIDALYFRLDDSKVVESEEVKPGIVLDFNAKKQVVGIEVLDLKRSLPE